VGEVLACVVCGQESHDVRMALIEWRHPLDGGAVFDFVPRCADRTACRSRCEAMGEDWPVAKPGGNRAA
jgi:hypothetical protein